MKRTAIVVGVLALVLSGCKVREDGSVVLDEIPTGKPGTVWVISPEGHLVTEYGYVVNDDGTFTHQR